jgi:hypothetical protein
MKGNLVARLPEKETILDWLLYRIRIVNVLYSKWYARCESVRILHSCSVLPRQPPGGASSWSSCVIRCLNSSNSNQLMQPTLFGKFSCPWA